MGYMEEHSKLCGKPQCLEISVKSTSGFTDCYVSLICASFEDQVGECTHVMYEYFDAVLGSQIHKICDKDPISGKPCQAVNFDLMVDDWDCFMQINNPVKGCTARCLHNWQALRRSNPVCSSNLADQMINTQVALGKALRKLG